LSGRDRGLRPDLEPTFKARWDTGLGFGAGIEYFSGLGHVGRVAMPADQEHFIYVIGDLVGAPWDLNIGIGRGLTGVSNAWTFKSSRRHRLLIVKASRLPGIIGCLNPARAIPASVGRDSPEPGQKAPNLNIPPTARPLMSLSSRPGRSTSVTMR
jgi:hypothetical protein